MFTAYPPGWLQQAACIHRYEMYGHIGTPGEWTTVGGGYGGYQFELRTWYSVGGTGSPAAASPAEQTYRAYRVWLRDGHSWREWTTARLCGLT